jgi:allantoin racemase
MQIALIGSAFNRGNPTALPAELRAVLDGGTAARIWVPNVSAFPRNALDLKIQEIGYIEAGLRAAKEGCDAIVLNTVGDYGLAALKSAVRVPVVGAGEAGMFHAAMLGRPFAIVTIWPADTAFLYEQQLRDARLHEQCAKVIFVGSPRELAEVGKVEDDYIARMQRGESAVLDRIVASCRAAVQDHGAASILLGCTCMSPVAAKVAQALEVPVVNPLTTAVKQAELLVRLGLSQSRVNHALADQPRDAAFAAMAETSAFHVAAEQCDACVFTPRD